MTEPTQGENVRRSGGRLPLYNNPRVSAYVVKRALGVAAGAVVIAAALAVLWSGTAEEQQAADAGAEAVDGTGVEPEGAVSVADAEGAGEPDIVMPIKSSRPGCEENDLCYIPSHVTAGVGEPVTWVNRDVAFHSITSGSYDEPVGLFDSGHLYPDEVFTLTFDEPGRYDYFCTLHPWMDGTITIE